MNSPADSPGTEVRLDAEDIAAMKARRQLQGPARSPLVAPPGPITPLTKRQTQIAARIGAGQTVAQIAASLSEQSGRRVTVNTVRMHIRRMAVKFLEPPEFSVRDRILLWVRWRQWERERKAQDEPKAMAK